MNIIDGYIKKTSWRVKENSNNNYSFGGLRAHVSGAIIAKHTLNNVYTKEIANAHRSADIHIHDLSCGTFAGYCCGYSLIKLLLEGFNGVTGKGSSSPAKHLDTAFAQIVSFVGTLQNEWAGAQAFNNFDTYLAPFIFYDKLSYKQVKQLMQQFVFGINQNARWGAENPFFNITLDWKVPESLKNNRVVIGGKLMNKTYGDFQKEMDIMNKAFIETMNEGDYKGNIFSFPIPTYNITKDFDWDSPNAELLFEMTGKYGIPYFQNFVNSSLNPEDIRSMCCRLNLDIRELKKKTGGLFGAGDSTGSIGVVTINMPRIGYVYKNNKEGFFNRLKELMIIAKDSLIIKRREITNHLNNGLLPYTKRYLGTFNNHFNTIGLNGMAESCLNFMNKSIETTEGKKFSLEVLDFMLETLRDFQEETGELFNLEATPAEGTSYRFAKHDKEEFPNIITAGTDDNPYYTNSTQLPVGLTDDMFEALQHQDELQCRYTSGCIEGGNKVLTDKGLMLIDDIVNNFNNLKPISALSYNKNKNISEWDEITKVHSIDVSNKDKIRVIGEKGLDITTTDWHPFFILDKDKVIEKKADELKKNDYILQNSTNLYSFKPSELNDDLMYLIGFFIGDGSMSKIIDNRGKNKIEKKLVRFFSERTKVLKKINYIINKYFGCNVKILQTDKRSNKLKVIASSKKTLYDFFTEYGFKTGKKTYNVSISDKIKHNINGHNVYALLSGLLDSDGTIDKKQGDAIYSTVSINLSNDIIETLNITGINHRKTIYKPKRKNESNIHIITIPSYEITNIKDKLSIVCERSLSFIKKKTTNRKKRHLPIIRVKQTSKVDVEDNIFYDLTTKNNHNYLAGNTALVFIHNTVFHTFVGARINDWRTVRELVKKIAYGFKLPYFSITPTFSICPIHGYISGEHRFCPYDHSQEDIEKHGVEVNDDE